MNVLPSEECFELLETLFHPAGPSVGETVVQLGFQDWWSEIHWYLLHPETLYPDWCWWSPVDSDGGNQISKSSLKSCCKKMFVTCTKWWQVSMCVRFLTWAVSYHHYALSKALTSLNNNHNNKKPLLPYIMSYNAFHVFCVGLNV